MNVFKPIIIAESDAQESYSFWQKRIRFALRRGNLETELLLVKFIEQTPPLDASERRIFETLLDCSEQDLFHWLLQPSEEVQAKPSAPPPHFAELIQRIQTLYLS
ncbi:MAG: succinate dehydrogenase assembly factor 2 [Thiotrichales bacterium]|nr:succinate dehydrogenase assembly factor 2 [Thiotrichales bacterium]